MKFIKYLTLSVVGAGLLFGCDPLASTYEELDKADTQSTDEGISKDVTLTLSADDYELALPYAKDGNDSASMETYKSFSDAQAREFIPYILKEKYFYLGAGSFATVTFEQYRGGSSAVYPYTDADSYELKSSDYYSVSTEAGDAGYLNSDAAVPSILLASQQDPADGAIVRAVYEYADKKYSDISGITPYDDSFDANIDAYVTQSVTGDQSWYWSSYSGDGFAKMSGYSSGNHANEDWLVTKGIDITGSNVVMEISHAIKFKSTEVFGQDLAVKISTDFDGVDVTKATWTNLTLDVWPAGDSYDLVNSTVSLDDYVGKKVYIGFYYTSTDAGATTWEVSKVTITAGEVVSTKQVNDFYTYSSGDASWSKIDHSTAYYLSADDYNSMGAPGQYDNFSSSVAPDDYIPEFLSINYPYAQEEDEIVVVYKYYSGSVQTRGNLYTFTDGMWSAYNSVVTASLLFGFSDGAWVPDNTIKYTLTSGDYSAIAANPDLANESARSNLDSYGNFNTNGGYWTQDDIVAAISFVLLEMNPDAEEGQKYQVTYDTYPGGVQEVALILSGGAYVPQ